MIPCARGVREQPGGSGPLVVWATMAAFIGLALPVVRADDWPQWLGPQRDGVWRESGILSKFPAGGPVVRWRTPINVGYTGPAVTGGRVYVMDWERAKDAQGANLPPVKGSIRGTERVLCLNEADGKVLWKHDYDCPYEKVSLEWLGPRATPAVHQGKVYTLGGMGDLKCLNAGTGQVLWSKSFYKDSKIEPPVWGWCTHPLIDGDKLICLAGGEGSAVIAFDKDTGAEKWRALTVQEIGYAPPMIFEIAGKRQLVIWHTEAVSALDPETGKVYWSERFPTEGQPVRPAISIATPRRMGDSLFVSSPHHGSLMLQLTAEPPGVRIAWKGKSNNLAKPDGLHSLITTPFIKDGHIYGVCNFGELRCLKASTGERLWESYALVGGQRTFFGTAFLVQQGDVFFILNEKGELIIAKLTPQGYEELDRTHLLDPTLTARGRLVVWSQPAFANKCCYARNDKEIICVSLAAEKRV